MSGLKRARLPDFDAIGTFRRHLGTSGLGSLPILIGLGLIWLAFWSQRPAYLSPFNVTNLLLQIAAMGTIAAGITLVLLIGEIDLSAGAVSGFSAAVMAVLSVTQGVPGPIAIASGILAGASVGLLQGLLITRFRIPSFVITLAGFMTWQGALLWVLGKTGTVNINDTWITGLAGTFFAPPIGWLAGIVFALTYATSLVVARRRRLMAGLPRMSMAGVIARSAVLSVGVGVAILSVNQDRGLPSAIVILVALVVGLDALTRRTQFGRHIYAVGGNPEAARRAGIQVDRVRLIVYVMCSALAAGGGILAASRLMAVNYSSGSGDLLLNSIASAVIGGTSLFGGRGRVWGALLGALVIGSIANGMDLLSFESSVKFMITGGVLVIAVIVEAMAGKGRVSGAA